MSKLGRYTRRAFLGLGAVAAGGVAFGYYYYRKPYENPLQAALAEGEVTLNPYVTIQADNTITVITPRAEMGQGVQTTLASLVAEELDADLDQLTIEHGPAAPAYYNATLLAEGGPFAFFDESFMARTGRSAMEVLGKFLALQVTGGSTSTVDAFVKMREAGCIARLTLVQAAANRWGVAPSSLKTERATVTNPANGESLTYGELASEAALLDPPSDMALRDPSQWKILKKSAPRVDLAEKVTGAPIFGIDVELPDMLHGTVKMSPRFGVGAKSYDDTAARAVKGVKKIIEIDTPTGKGFGIIAENTWAAFQGAEALEVEWDEAPYPASSDGLWKLYDAALTKEPDFALRDDGDAPAALAAASDVLEAEYKVPFLSHATMEPMNATVQLKDGKLTVWTGTQSPGFVEMLCARQLGLETEDVTCHTTFLGGGFGRRGEVDYPVSAAVFAPHTEGRPIKVTWSREEDMTHDLYRPMAKGKLRAALSDGKISALEARIAAPSLMKQVVGRYFPSISPAGPDNSVLQGFFDQPLTVPDIKVGGHLVEMGVPISFWRSVGNSFNGYFHECFLDELAEKAGKDPLDFRLAHMEDPRFAPAVGALKRAAEMSGWGTPLPEGRGRGIAHTLSFGAWVAQVVEVTATENGIAIDKVWCAADPGMVLNPEIFHDQITGGIIFGLSAALGQEITIDEGEVQETNFDTFDAMRMYQTPQIEVALLETSPKMGGAGEPGTPPAVPALANAIYAATGKRIRTMPLSHEVDFV